MFKTKNENALGFSVRISADVNVNTAYMISFEAVFGGLTDLFRRLLPGAANVRQVMRSLRDFSRSSASVYMDERNTLDRI